MEPDLKRMARISLTIGEIVYNLRTALDYTIWALAYANTKEEVEGTQFPIETSKSMFDARITGLTPKRKKAKRYLRGVHRDAVLLIRMLQPYKGCTWTSDLQDLSNPDKHRHLLPLRGTHSITINQADVVKQDPETGLYTIGLHYDAEIEMLFIDNRPVVETLKYLHDEVVATISLLQKTL